MNAIEFLRNKAFWTLDKKAGSPIKRYLTDLQHIEGGGGTQITDYQEEKLKELMQHCIATVPAYRDMKSFDLKDWPVVNKNVLREDKQAHLSNKFSEDSLISMSTSGSTGTPFSCLQDKNKKKHVNAEVMFYSSPTGYKIGKRIIYLRAMVRKVQKSPLQKFMQNIYPIDCKDLSDKGVEELLDEIRRLSSGSGAMILAYASTLNAFRKYFETHGIEAARGCKIGGIISGSEMLYDNTRESMEKAFGCKCYSRYSNEENGIIGQDCEENNVFILNRASYILEILKFDSDERASEGEVGRVVITDLFNYAMPMVRYDTGDAGALIETTHKGEKILALGKFAGRAVDMVFDCDGNQISPHSISNTLWKYEGIKQYQFIQKSKTEFLVKIATGSEFDEKELIDDLSSICGKDAQLKIEIVDEIPVLASGKRRYIVNESNIK